MTVIERAAPVPTAGPVPGGDVDAAPAGLRRAIVRAVAYADVFGAPLPVTALVAALEVPANPAAVLAAIVDRDWAAGILEPGGGPLALAGRGRLRELAVERAAVSARRWRTARRFAGLLGRLPFVRCVAVSGSLAADWSDADADIDLFVVTADGRLWLTRAAILAIARLARLGGVVLCPNYLVVESALELDERDLFTAHELTRLVPLAGAPTHARLLARNRWTLHHLPNAGTPTPGGSVDPRIDPARLGRRRRFVERLLRTRPVDRLEAWEMRRKVRRLAAAGGPETRYDAARCKGHVDGHRGRALEAFAARLAALPEAYR